jgi:hypothetical protein
LRAWASIPAELVDADNPHACPGDQREVPACSARRVEHSGAGRDHAEHARYPLLLSVSGVEVQVVGRRLGFVVGHDRGSPFGQPCLPLHVMLLKFGTKFD